ncbi:MAG: anthranilate synthase component I family protein [Moraxellaceae bacterium]
MSIAIVKQNIATLPNDSIQTVLVALREWASLIWLADDAQPVIGLCPRWQVTQYGTRVQWRQRDTHTDGQLSTAVDLSQRFEQVVQDAWQVSQLHAWQLPALTGFRGGLMGFLGYDWAAARHGIGKNQKNVTDSGTACNAWLGCYDIFLRQEDSGWQLYGEDCPSLQPLYARIAACFRQAQATHLLSQSSRFRQAQAACTPFAARWSWQQYQHAFTQVQDYLRAGDCYQVNLTQAFDARISGQLLSRLDQLQLLTRAPFAGYMAIGSEHELLSCSPELFLSFLPDGEVVTRPIKGTQPRHADPQQDAARKQQLAQSEKDQAENLMIVDLLRNDLARQAQIGSVRVPKLFEIESFAQVHHLVSEIRATLAAGQSPLELLFDALPGGSITGAPKIRAMQIIAELEAGQRGAYCGSMGYLNADGTGRFNILIRTLERIGAQVSVWAGGGITIASEVDQEYQECWDKIGAILRCLEQA